jgi:EAL domain-containing protein (putative c-di-GMP-specific phosphodiesterase class I)
MSENAETGVGELLNATGLLERVSDQALQLVPAAQGVLVGLCNDQYVTYVSGAGFLAPHVGTRVDKDASLSGLAMRTRRVVHCGDTETDPHADLEACRRLRVTSSVCIPLCRGDEVLGVICVSSSRRDAFAVGDVDLMTRLADVMGVAVGLAADLTRVAEGTSLIAAHTAEPASADDSPLSPIPADSAVNDFVMNVLQPDAASLRHRRDRIQAVLDNPEILTMVFQPIVEIERQSVVGVEALARFEGDPPQTPDHWFADAHLVGLGVELELCAVRKACASLDLLPAEWDLAVNVGPETIMSPALTEILAGYDPHRIVVELTEQRRVLDYPGLLSTLQRLRRAGCRFAVDDAGAGFASLSHILKLAPNFIKLDRDLVAGINFDPVRRVLVGALMTFATDTGSQIIAEGVENQEEMDALQCLGVRLFQGFLIRRPTPIERLLRTATDLFPSVSVVEDDAVPAMVRSRAATRDDCGRPRAIGRAIFE